MTYTTNEAEDAIVAWSGPGSGSWNDAYNWQRTSTSDGGGFIPDSENQTAVLGSTISQPSLVFVDEDVTVGGIEFDQSQHSYTVAGSGKLALDDTVDAAVLLVNSGVHQISTPLEFTADVDAAIVGSLSLQNAVDFQGNTLTHTGGGELAFNSALAGTIGELVLQNGILSGVGTVGASVQNTGGVMAPGSPVPSSEVVTIPAQEAIAPEPGGWVMFAVGWLMSVAGRRRIYGSSATSLSARSPNVPMKSEALSL